MKPFSRTEQAEARFHEFASAFHLSLYRQAFALTGRREPAEDLVQETLTRMYVAWFKPRSIDSPRAYASQTMVRIFLTSKRKRLREHEYIAAEVGSSRQPSPPDDPSSRLALLSALDGLPPRTRAAVILRYWEDLSIEETAHALGCSPGNVKSLSHRGLQHLKRVLAPSLETEGAKG